MKKISFCLNIILIIIIAILLFLKLESKKPESLINYSNSLDTFKKYPLISKRVLNESENDLLLRFVDLRQSLKDAVKPYGDSFAFYFEYLPTGTSIGVNEKQDFNPASLGKVPLAMAFYLNKEQKEIDLKKKVKIKPEYLANTTSGSLWKRGVGAEVSFEEAIAIMLEESDNTAALLLYDYTTQKDFEDVYNGLDLPPVFY